MTDQRRDPSKTAVFENLGGNAPGFKKKYKPTGVYITKAQRETIAKIATATGQKDYSILRYAIAYFLKAYEHDPGIIQVETKQVFKQP